MTIQLRHFIFFLSLSAAGACSCGKGSSAKTNPGGNTPPGAANTTFTNPLLTSGPDPWVIQQDTMYYYMNTLGNRLAIWPTNKMSNLGNVVPVTIWNPPASGLYSKDIWAPELHYFNSKWYMYFAADDGNNNNHRIYALENDNADPTTLSWIFKGKVADTTADRWAIDASAFEYNNKLYLIWSGWADTVNVAQNIYIAAMSDPTTVASPRVLLSSPTLSWEKVGTPPSVNEGPEALINPNGQLFLTYSASGCWTDSYCLGLLTLKTGGDPLNPSDWTKSQNPVFTTAADSGAYAPGHNGFFVSRAGSENWLLYHANPNQGEGCGNARSPRMQRFSWNADGSPNFGTPAKINTPLTKPSGE